MSPKKSKCVETVEKVKILLDQVQKAYQLDNKDIFKNGDNP